MKTGFVRLCIAVFVGVSFCVNACVNVGGLVNAAPPAPARPNIVLIVADDLGFSDLGCYGGEISTPHLDRLADEGLRFTQFYNCGTGILSRTSLYTGLYPRLGPAGSTRGLLRSNMTTLGEVLREAGYATVLTGKWPLGAQSPNRAIDRGFAEFYGVLGSRSHHFNPAQPDPAEFVEGGESRVFAHNETPIEEFSEDFYSTDAFTEHAIKMIHRSAEARQPFFINLCYTAPHYPIQAPAEDIARYRGKYQAGYDAVRQRRYRRQLELGLFESGTAGLSPAALDQLYEHEILTWNRLNQETREREEQRMEVYAAMVHRLDRGIGRVLAALDEADVAENTVVFFLSDNGGCTHFPFRSVQITPRMEREPVVAFNRGIPVGDGRGFEFVALAWGWVQNAPFRRNKNWTYEGGICTPMIVRWPGVVSPGGLTREPGHVVDFMPTLIELAGAEYPRQLHDQSVLPMEGRSLLSTLRAETPPPRETPLGWELYGSRAFRDGDWKLVWDAGHKVWALYNLATDRSEMVDLAAQHPERVAAMADAWKQWARQTDAPIR